MEKENKKEKEVSGTVIGLRLRANDWRRCGSLCPELLFLMAPSRGVAGTVPLMEPERSRETCWCGDTKEGGLRVGEDVRLTGEIFREDGGIEVGNEVAHTTGAALLGFNGPPGNNPNGNQTSGYAVDSFMPRTAPFCWCWCSSRKRTYVRPGNIQTCACKCFPTPWRTNVSRPCAQHEQKNVNPTQVQVEANSSSSNGATFCLQ